MLDMAWWGGELVAACKNLRIAILTDPGRRSLFGKFHDSQDLKVSETNRGGERTSWWGNAVR